MARSVVLVFLVCAGFAGCAPSLNAVKATAGIGTSLGGYQSAFDLAAVICHYAEVDGPDAQCTSIAADLENWRAVNRVLVGYAAALAAMADDSKDASQQTNIATALAGGAKIGDAWSAALNPNVAAGVSTGFATLSAGITGVYRRERLSRTIRDSAAAVEAIAAGVDQNIQLLDRAALNITNTLTDTLTSVQAGRTSPAADRLGLQMALAAMQLDLAAHRQTLAAYKAAVDSFAKAHTHLKDGLHGLGDRDADVELLKLIANDVSTIYKNAKLATTTP